MAQLPDVIRSGIRIEDLTDLPPEIRKGMEPLLRYVNSGIQGIAQAFSSQISVSQNLDCEVQTVNLSHGVAQTISLKKLSQAKGIDCISVGSADGKTRHALAMPPVLTGTTTPDSVRVTAYFVDPSAVRVPVTIRLWPEGSYSAIAPETMGAWIAMPYAANWGDFGSGNLAGGYTRDASGFVHLRGFSKYALAAGGSGITMATLPAGYRPSAICSYAVANWNGAAWAIGSLQITTTGTIVTTMFVNGGANTSGLSFDGVTFDTRT